MAQKKKVVKKKVSPYPLEGEMVLGASKIILSITRVNLKGMVAVVRTGICQVGIRYQCQFKLPTSSFLVHAEGQVYKTTDSVNPQTGKAERMVQVLFIKMSDEERGKIRNFHTVIGQKE